MVYFWNGIQLGLLLSLMAGPILFALIQAGVERGFRAGAALGTGIWISDLLFIFTAYMGSSALDRALSDDQTLRWLGIVGSLLLLAIGLVTLLSQPPKIKYVSEIGARRSPYHLLWLKGFAINTLNPFTFFFWLSISTGIVLADDLDQPQATSLFAGILLAIILTDLLKVLLAKRIRTFLKWKHLVWLRRIAGIALIGFGLALFIRVLWQFG